MKRVNEMPLFRIFSFAIVFALIVAAPAQAHKIGIFATAGEGVIQGECFSSGGGAVAGATIEVTAGIDGEKLGETITDAEGRFRFEIIRNVDHTFVLGTKDGHRAAYTVPASEIFGVPRAPLNGVEDVGQPEQNSMIINHFDARVELAVAKAMQPLRHQLDEYQRRATMHDILGGIGYIVGIMGLIFFLRGRKPSNQGG